jgi:hypothetical protein
VVPLKICATKASGSGNDSVFMGVMMVRARPNRATPKRATRCDAWPTRASYSLAGSWVHVAAAACWCACDEATGSLNLVVDVVATQRLHLSGG